MNNPIFYSLFSTHCNDCVSARHGICDDDLTIPVKNRIHFYRLCVFNRMIFVDSLPPVIGLTRSELRGRFVAKVSSGDVPTSISREYRELSQGLYGFGLGSVAYWLLLTMNGVTTYTSWHSANRGWWNRSRGVVHISNIDRARQEQWDSAVGTFEYLGLFDYLIYFSVGSPKNKLMSYRAVIVIHDSYFIIILQIILICNNFTDYIDLSLTSFKNKQWLFIISIYICYITKKVMSIF